MQDEGRRRPMECENGEMVLHIDHLHLPPRQRRMYLARSQVPHGHKA